MKNKWLKVMAFAFALIFTVSLGAFNSTPVMADEEMSETAASLKDSLTQVIKQFNTKSSVDSYINQTVSEYEQYYGEGAGEEVKEMWAFLYDWVEIQKKVGNFEKVTDFTYDEDEETADITTATMKIKCKDGEAILSYNLTDEGVNVTIEKKATFGELMIKAALNTLLGMGTVFIVLIFICLIISCFKFMHKEEKEEKTAPTVPVAAKAAEIVEEEDVTDDLELVAVISAAIAAAEGSGCEGFQVRSIKRVRRSNW